MGLVMVDGVQPQVPARGPGDPRTHDATPCRLLGQAQQGEPGHPPLPGHGRQAARAQGLPVGVAAPVEGLGEPLWRAAPAAGQRQVGGADPPLPGPGQAGAQGQVGEAGGALAPGGTLLGQGEAQLAVGDQRHAGVVAVPEAQDRIGAQISPRRSARPSTQASAWSANRVLQVFRSPPPAS